MTNKSTKLIQAFASEGSILVQISGVHFRLKHPARLTKVTVTFGKAKEEGATGPIHYPLSIRLDIERTKGQHA